ncbi:MAG: TIGR04053 family radical SAM/SPASM domain-containing protein [Cellulomonadaceae bacterium]|nr:TIGR04053 family radical SAM/SPASM domain-containing protein [Cellulomonadaceae bacterium]
MTPNDHWQYERAPMIVYWELTNACDLACRHCRATAMPEAAPGELTTAEAVAVLDQVVEFGEPTPHVTMTGGDPLKRPDLLTLLDAAHERGLGVSLAPAVTPLLTKERLAEVQQHGVQAISLSLDGATAEFHDGLRGVPGTFDHTMEALEWAADLGLNVQVNTLVSAGNLHEIEQVFALLSTKTLMRWSLFFLISVGRGSELTELTPDAAENLMRQAAAWGRTAPFQVRTTEAPSSRRVTAQTMMNRGMPRTAVEATPFARSFGIRDGNGIVFISHQGDVTPSGFMPLPLGNVKSDRLADIYQGNSTMMALRDPDQFKGRCGRCEFNHWCGGSRARAFAWTGDPLQTDPLCGYQPSGSQTSGNHLRGHQPRQTQAPGTATQEGTSA